MLEILMDGEPLQVQMCGANEHGHTIFLLNDNDVDGTAESSGIQRVVGIPHGAKRVPHVLHVGGGNGGWTALLLWSCPYVPAVVAVRRVVWSRRQGWARGWSEAGCWR